MGRFYSTTQRNFQDDFIFQPDMNLALMALQKKDNDIKEQLSTLDLFENLPVDYWKDADQENVKAIKESYANKVADIAASMQGDITNTGASKRAINNLRREIENDYEFGQIRDIQENARTYKEFDAMLKSMPNPADREGYKKMVQNYLGGAQGKGALSSVFKPEELYNSRDLWGEFTQSAAFKNLQPDERSSQAVKIGGQWIMKEGNQNVSLSESKIGKAFKAFIDSNNLGGYGQSRQNYFGEDWLDEKGNVRMDDNSFLGNLMINGIPSLAYSKKASSQDAQANPYGTAAYSAALQERAAVNAHKRATELAKIQAKASGENGASTGWSNLAQEKVAQQLGVNEYLQDRLSKFIGPLAKKLNGVSGNTSSKQNRLAIEKILVDKNLQKEFPNIYKHTVNFQKEMDAASISSKELIYNFYGQDKTKTDMFLSSVGSTAMRGAKLFVPSGYGNTTEALNFTYDQLNNGKGVFKGMKIDPGTFEIDDKEIGLMGALSMDTYSQGVYSIPVTYQSGGNTYNDYVYMQAKNKHLR